MIENPNRTRISDRVAIYPRGKTKIYAADYWLDGMHRRVSLKTRNRKVAIQRAVKLAAGLADGTYQKPTAPMAVRQAIEEYLSYLDVKGRARKTIVRYRGELRAWREFLESQKAPRLDQITPVLFDRFRALRKKDHGPRTLYHEGVVVKQFLKWCKRRKLSTANPLEEVELEKPPLERRGGPSLEQVNQILDALDAPRFTQIALVSLTGMRAGELQRQKPEDVDLEGNWIHIRSREGAETKTRYSRKVPIHSRLRPLLERLSREDRRWLFTAPASRKYPDGSHWINIKRLNEDFQKAARRLGLPTGRDKGGYTLHSLRHFFETCCVNARIPQRVVDAWLGHTGDRSMGSIYYMLSDEESQAFMKKVPFGTGAPAADAGKKE